MSVTPKSLTLRLQRNPRFAEFITDPSLLPNIQAILGHATPQQTLDYMDLTDAYSAEAFVRKMERQEPNKLRAVK